MIYCDKALNDQENPNEICSRCLDKKNLKCKYEESYQKGFTEGYNQAISDAIKNLEERKL